MVRAGAEDTPDTGGLPGAAPYRALLHNREYVGLLASGAISLIGDQVARVALTALVYDRTGDALFSAIAYAATWLPAAFGPLLSGIADRVPRRRVLIATDMLRAVLLAVMVLPGLGWGVLVALVSVVTLLEAPFRAARAPLLRETLADDAFRLGSGLDESVQQQGVTGGFLVAGATLAAAGPRVSLLIDAASFVVAAGVVRVLVSGMRQAADGSQALSPRTGGVLRRAANDVLVGWSAATARGCLRPLLLCWAAASAVIAPEAVIAPWARSMHVGGVMVGILFAAPAVGCVAALPLIGRVDAARTQRLVLPLIALSIAPLWLCGLGVSASAAVVLLALSGAGSSFTVLTRVEFLLHVRDEVSGRAYGIASAGLYAGQGAVVLLAGALSRDFGAGRSIAAVGLVGGLLVLSVVILTRIEPPPEEVPIVLPDASDRPGKSLASAH